MHGALPAQENAASLVLPGQHQGQDELSINLREKGALDLPALVQWAGEIQGFELLLDNESFQQAQNKVVFLSRVNVDRDTFMLLIQEVLRANGFALVDGPVNGWKKIVALNNVTPFAPLLEPGAPAQPDFQYVSAIFQLEHVTAEEAKSWLAIFASNIPSSTDPSNIRTLQNGRLLIVTDLYSNIQRIENLITRLDVPQEETTTEFYRVENLEAGELETQLNAIIGTRRMTDSPPDASSDATPPLPGSYAPTGVKIVSDERTNRLILIGPTRSIRELMDLIQKLDVPLETELRTYQFSDISAKRIDDLILQSLSGVSEASRARAYNGTVDSQSNQLVVSARPEIHKRIEQLRQQLDRPATKDEQSPIRFYTLKNVKVSDIVDTLQSIERKTRDRRQPRTPLTGISARPGFQPTGPNNFNSSIGEGPPVLPPSSGAFNPGQNLPFGTGVQNRGGFGNNSRGIDDAAAFGDSLVGDIARLVDNAIPQDKIIPGEAKITVDENTNTLIVVAEPEIQALYEQLIKRLDVRRAQVMIEAHVVMITGRDTLNLGIEVSGGDRVGDDRLFAFSNFGLSEIDSSNGRLAISPATGFNGTLLDAQTADIVLQALSRSSRARVVTSPKILVDDNGDGLLSSVAEQPFSSVNANNTVATTSFGGFAQAGTTINVTPHISEDDHLNLEFDILVNNFTGTGANGLPPPRNTDQIVSQVTIPDGYTVIVGGLRRQLVSEDISGLPGWKRFPLLKLLGSSQTAEDSDAMLFVFLKPVILRDDQFRDLLYLSEVDQDNSCLPGDFPESEPVLIR